MKKEVEKIIPQIEKEVGPIDILVNNAGIIKRIPILEMKADEFRQVLDVDLTGPFIMSKAVAKGMVERGGGKIINMCSMMSELGRNTVSAYAAAKGGLKMLTKNMATEWARFNIQTNGIGPGYFATTQTAPIRVDGHPFNDFIIGRTPAARWGDPEDLAGAAIIPGFKSFRFCKWHCALCGWRNSGHHRKTSKRRLNQTNHVTMKLNNLALYCLSFWLYPAVQMRTSSLRSSI